MTKEEIANIIDDKKFNETIRCYGDDKLGNLIKEIYYDGMRNGYELAKFRLELLNRLPFGAADKYLEKYREDIKEVIKLCQQYEACSKI